MISNVDFLDRFNRHNGAVGNGWSNTPSTASLVIKHDALTNLSTDPGGIFRPVDMSRTIRVSETLTEQNGAGGLHDRFQTYIMFGSDGSPIDGLGIHVVRSDSNFSNSKVELIFNGSALATQLSTFQFHSSIVITVTYHPTDESISGIIAGSGQHFEFSFNTREITGNNSLPPVSLHGSNLEIYQPGIDDRGPVIYPTIDNLSVHEVSGRVSIVSGGTIEQDYSNWIRWDNILGAKYPAGYGDKLLTHTGVDIQVAPNAHTEIDAFASGIVEAIGSPTSTPVGGPGTPYGYWVLIRHPVDDTHPENAAIANGKTFYTLYLHMNEPPHNEHGDPLYINEAITAGHEIGQVGNNCGAFGDNWHVHFEIRLFDDFFSNFSPKAAWRLPDGHGGYKNPNIYLYGTHSEAELFQNGRGYLNPEDFIDQSGEAVVVAPLPPTAFVESFEHQHHLPPMLAHLADLCAIA